jgi:hypothetical protein
MVLDMINTDTSFFPHFSLDRFFNRLSRFYKASKTGEEVLGPDFLSAKEHLLLVV